MSRRVGLILALAALLLGFVGVGSAQAVVDNDISVSYAHSTAYRVGNGASLRFYGVIQAKAPGSCYQMQYKTPAGNWTTEGFYNSPTSQLIPLWHCQGDGDYQDWSIHDGLDVRGIRFTNGVQTGTHCDSATNCRNMYP